MSDELLRRIVIDPAICGGRPTIRGTRIRASDILEMLAGGTSQAEILKDFDELERDDVKAAILFAARSIASPVLRVA
jgi:uncharacterized protein (DUF433 family)